MGNAHYKCLNYSHEFYDAPGPVACPKCCSGRDMQECEHKYVKWLNYEEMRKNNFK